MRELYYIKKGSEGMAKEEALLFKNLFWIILNWEGRGRRIREKACIDSIFSLPLLFYDTELAKDFKVKNFVFASSSSVYGDRANPPFKG